MIHYIERVVKLSVVCEYTLLGKEYHMKKMMRRQQEEGSNGFPTLVLGKCLILAYVVTGFMLLLVALLLYKVRLSAKAVAVSIILIYIIATFLAGFLAGKKLKSRKFMWGLLLGISYFLILVLISLAVNHSVSDLTNSLLTTLLLCAGGGMLGGMLS